MLQEMARQAAAPLLPGVLLLLSILPATQQGGKERKAPSRTPARASLRSCGDPPRVPGLRHPHPPGNPSPVPRLSPAPAAQPRAGTVTHLALPWGHYRREVGRPPWMDATSTESSLLPKPAGGLRPGGTGCHRRWWHGEIGNGTSASSTCQREAARGVLVRGLGT